MQKSAQARLKKGPLPLRGSLIAFCCHKSIDHFAWLLGRHLYLLSTTCSSLRSDHFCLRILWPWVAFTWMTFWQLVLNCRSLLFSHSSHLSHLSDGILLHQHLYTQEFLRECSSHVSARKRTASSEPDHFKKDPPPGTDHANPEHMEWVKVGQRILGGMLCLSARARPHLAFAVSSAAQVLTKDVEQHLKVKLRHLLQYQSTTQTLGLLYQYPRSREMSEFTVFSDASFAPSGWQSQSGYAIHLSYGFTRHVVHWQIN